MAKKVVIVFRHPIDHAAAPRNPDDPLPRMKIASLVKEVPNDRDHPESYADWLVEHHKQEFSKKLIEYRSVPFTYEIHDLE